MKRFLLLFCAAFVVILMFTSFGKKSVENEKYRENPLAAWGAMKFYNTANAWPNADIPEDAFQNGFLQYQERFGTPSTRSVQTATWTSIGPTNLGGRTLSFAIDPTDTAAIWLGSAGGGLWKSTTGGVGNNAWTYVPTGFPVRAVSAIAINPGNRNEMYIGTGETYSYATTVNGLVDRPTRGTVGIGILKSTDRGVTWTQVLNWSYNQKRGIWDIQYNKLNTNILYAATTEGVYKTSDGGATWTQVLNQEMVMDIECDPIDTNVVYAGVGNVNSPIHGIYRTTNSGASWTLLATGLPPQTNKGRITITCLPQNHKTVFAEIGDLFATIGLYRSRDEGNTWTAVNTSTDVLSYQGWYAKGLLIKSNDSTRIMLGGVDVFRSTNSGTSLTDITGNSPHSDIHGIFGNPSNSNMVYFLTDGGLYRTNDFGNSFYSCSGGYVTSQFYIGAVSTQTANMVLGGVQDNYTNLYQGTTSWVNEIGGDGAFCAINPRNDQNQYGSYQYLNVLRTDDVWNNTYDQILTEPSNAAGGNPAAFIAPIILCKSDTSVLYAGTNYLMRSNDRGNTWLSDSVFVDNGNVILSITCSATSLDTLYFTTVPSDTGTGVTHVFRSTDGGVTVSNITGSLPNRYPRCIAVNPHNSREVFVVYSGFGTGHVFKSSNNGNTWTDMTGTLPDLPFHTVFYHPNTPDTVFLGCDMGVFASTNGGTSWFAMSNGLPTGALVFDLRYSPVDNSLVAFTHGNGVWKASLANFTTDVTETARLVHDFVQSIYSNPTRNTIQLMINSDKASSATISIYDMNGRIMKQLSRQSVTIGQNHIAVDVQSLSSGTYILKTEMGADNAVSRFVID